LDVLCFGSIVVDHRRTQTAAASDRAPLSIVDRAVHLRVGGIPILAVALKQAGYDVGLMGCVGRDIAGYGLRSYLADEVGLNVDAVRFTEAPTSSSLIHLTPRQRYIQHTPGANALLLPTDEDRAFLAGHRPRLMAVGYSGILPRLDADGGREMAAWIATAQAHGAVVGLDTHTVPSFGMLEKPARACDLFFCNAEEAARITGVSAERPADMLAAIGSGFPAADPSRHRLLGVSMPHGGQIAYGRGGRFHSEWVANPHFGAFAPADLTGAGDYFRSGVYACVLDHLDDFLSGRLDVVQAARRGHDAAAENLSRQA
jgi:sugar/nucleoside kinase (ribokinase family)